jgi:hypothetical protein
MWIIFKFQTNCGSELNIIFQNRRNPAPAVFHQLQPERF